MEQPEVFYTHEWAVAVHRAFGDVRKPLLLLAYENQLLVGVVALTREKERRAEASFLAASTADYCDFLSHPEHRTQFVEAVLRELQIREIDSLVLTNLPVDSCSLPALSAAASNCHYNLYKRSAYHCARVVLGTPEQRAALKVATVSKKRLRRNLRELQKRGRVCFRHDTHWDEIEPRLRPFNRAHVARFLSTGRISNLIRAERRKFLYELAHELSFSSWLTLSSLFVGDVPVAWNYGFQFPGSWFWYQPTVHSGHEYSDFSPGYCLLAQIVEQACDRPEVDVVDLGLGAEEYKERFATAARETLCCVLTRSFTRHLRKVTREWAAASARSAGLENMLRIAISSVARGRARLRETGIRGLLTTLGRQLCASVYSHEKVIFFEWAAQEAKRDRKTKLAPLDPELLGEAAILYADDPASTQFLMRSAQRFRLEPIQGFVLVTAEGTPVHFCWVAEFERFRMAELNRILHAPSPDAVMIFDCFTPNPIRGRGFFGETITALAEQLRAEGKAPWIFSAEANKRSLRGIAKSGFTYRFFCVRKKILFSEKTEDSMDNLQAKHDNSVTARSTDCQKGNDKNLS